MMDEILELIREYGREKHNQGMNDASYWAAVQASQDAAEAEDILEQITDRLRKLEAERTVLDTRKEGKLWAFLHDSIHECYKKLNATGSSVEYHAILDGVSSALTDNLVERFLEAERTVQVPEGWQLVPIEPTPEMIYAMRAFNEMCFDQFGRGADQDETYRAAISAAPKPEGEQKS